VPPRRAQELPRALAGAGCWAGMSQRLRQGWAPLTRDRKPAARQGVPMGHAKPTGILSFFFCGVGNSSCTCIRGRNGQGCCPGFGQDRVNFHRNPGRDTAGQADPTGPNRAGYSIPCAVMLGSGGGERGGGNSLAARERGHRSGLGERLCGSCSLCCVFSLSVSLLLLFPFLMFC